MTTTPRIFGHIDGVPVGAQFANRKELSGAGVHRPLQAGISGGPSDGADSIVVSGGYEDDEDEGDFITYTGQGGNDPVTKKQIADQEFVRGNAALAKSCDEGLPVRVVRGSAGDPAQSPPHGFRYDGLFRVDRYWHEIGKSGFRIYRFRLIKLSLIPEYEPPALPSGAVAPPTKVALIQRVVRSTAVAQAVKQIHKHTCQFCGSRLELATGPYAEGAHIRPLGKPHKGPDTPENVLCLCPNCHVRFDAGAIALNDDFEVVDQLSGQVLGRVRTAPGHAVAVRFVDYHRSTIAVAP